MHDESAFDRGVRLLGAGQPEAALEQFKVSLAAAEAEQRADSRYNIAVCYVRLGRTDEAVQAVSEAVAADPNIIADIARDEDFALLRQETGFVQLLHRSHGGGSPGVGELAAAVTQDGLANTPAQRWSDTYASAFATYGGYAGFAAMFALPRKARLSAQRGLALTGMGLSLVGLLLSAANGYLGALMMMRAGLELRR